MILSPLRDALSEPRFGGKASQLASALRAGFPVPDGSALSVALVDAIAEGSAKSHELEEALTRAGSWCAVRSSAVGEDSVSASFAGQHLTVLGVTSSASLATAIHRVWSSARAPSALAYRARLGIQGPPRMAVVVQALVPSEVAGVLFTRNPSTGADERVIEGSWGLGESVVAGMVTPDRFRVARDGRVLERCLGEKDMAIEALPDGSTIQRAIHGSRATTLCLSDAQLTRLSELAARAEAHFGGDQDLEWGFVRDELFLLQRRAITTKRQHASSRPL